MILIIILEVLIMPQLHFMNQDHTAKNICA